MPSLCVFVREYLIKCSEAKPLFGGYCGVLRLGWCSFHSCKIEPDNGNVHRAAAKIIASKSRAARGSVASRPVSLGFRLAYAVSVYHRFPNVVA